MSDPDETTLAAIADEGAIAEAERAEDQRVERIREVMKRSHQGLAGDVVRLEDEVAKLHAAITDHIRDAEYEESVRSNTR